MAELKNTFSWSFSAAEDFDLCRRKRFWAKYAMWGGWSAEASALQKDAYRLGKMENAWSTLGRAVEDAVMWALRRHQAGVAVTAEEAYEHGARPHLIRAWTESRKKLYLQNPKKHICLREHYYQEWPTARETEVMEAVKAQARACIDHFMETVLPRLAHVNPAQEIRVAIIGSGGDPESFTLNGMKIYAIPDYVYRDGDRLHIHDWKAGKAKESHAEQLKLYGLWAQVKHGVPPDKVDIFIEYLAEGTLRQLALTEEDLEAVKTRISDSVSEMTDYLVDNDLARNLPLPQEDWDLTLDYRCCRLCNYVELCKKDAEYRPGEGG
jgi:hypothetical protein